MTDNELRHPTAPEGAVGPDRSWELLSRKRVLDTAVFEVNLHRFRSRHGKEGDFVVLGSRDWAMVIAEVPGSDHADPDLLMVRQFRFGSRALSVEFPGGVVERGEDPGAAALRELREETGYRAASCVHLASFWPNPATQENRFHVFLAKDLAHEGEPELDETEDVGLETVKLSELRRGLGKPPFDHGLLVASVGIYLNGCR